MLKNLGCLTWSVSLLLEKLACVLHIFTNLQLDSEAWPDSCLSPLAVCTVVGGVCVCVCVCCIRRPIMSGCLYFRDNSSYWCPMSRFINTMEVVCWWYCNYVSFSVFNCNVYNSVSSVTSLYLWNHHHHQDHRHIHHIRKFPLTSFIIVVVVIITCGKNT